MLKGYKMIKNEPTEYKEENQEERDITQQIIHLQMAVSCLENSFNALKDKLQPVSKDCKGGYIYKHKELTKETNSITGIRVYGIKCRIENLNLKIKETIEVLDL